MRDAERSIHSAAAQAPTRCRGQALARQSGPHCAPNAKASLGLQRDDIVFEQSRRCVPRRARHMRYQAASGRGRRPIRRDLAGERRGGDVVLPAVVGLGIRRTSKRDQTQPRHAGTSPWCWVPYRQWHRAIPTRKIMWSRLAARSVAGERCRRSEARSAAPGIRHARGCVANWAC